MTTGTYDQLSALATAGELIPGERYLLTDYRTIYVQPGTGALKTGETTETLLLTAVSPERFDFRAASYDYPQDEIEYDFTAGMADEEHYRPGFILRRTDRRLNISAPCDWRTMKWARFRISASGAPERSLDDGLELARGGFYAVDGALCKALASGKLETGAENGEVVVEVAENYLSNYILAKEMRCGLTPNRSDYAEYYTFDLNGAEGSAYCANIHIGEPAVSDRLTGARPLPNNVFRFTSYERAPHDITTDGEFRDNTVGDNCYYSTFGYGFVNNVLLTDCDHMEIGIDCYDNWFGKYCAMISMRSKCWGNLLGERCHGGRFEVNCYQNTFGDHCYSNSYGSFFHDNMIGRVCHANDYGPYFYSNRVGPYNSHCTYGSGFAQNAVGTSFVGAQIGSEISCMDFTAAPEMYNTEKLDRFHTVSLLRDDAGEVRICRLDSAGECTSTTV